MEKVIRLTALIGCLLTPFIAFAQQADDHPSPSAVYFYRVLEGDDIKYLNNKTQKSLRQKGYPKRECWVKLFPYSEPIRVFYSNAPKEISLAEAKSYDYKGKHREYFINDPDTEHEWKQPKASYDLYLILRVRPKVTDEGKYYRIKVDGLLSLPPSPVMCSLYMGGDMGYLYPGEPSQDIRQ